MTGCRQLAVSDLELSDVLTKATGSVNLIRNVTNDFKVVFTANLQGNEAVDLSFTSDEFTSGLLVEFHLKGLTACSFSEHMSRIHHTAARLFERSTGQLYCFHGKSRVISRHASEVGIQYDSASRGAFIHYRLPCRESLAHIAMAARQYQKIEVSLDVGWSEIDFQKVAGEARFNLDVVGISITYN